MPKGLQLNTPSLMVSKCILREDQEQDNTHDILPKAIF